MIENFVIDTISNQIGHTSFSCQLHVVNNYSLIIGNKKLKQLITALFKLLCVHKNMT